MKTLKVSDVLKEGLNLYKDNFSKLFKASLLYVLIQLINSTITFLDSLLSIGIISFITFIVSLASFYFGFRMLISVSILARDIFTSKESELVGAYAEAEQYFWRYIGNSLLVTIPIVVPIYFVVSLQNARIPYMYKFPQYVVIAIVIGIISSYLYFAPISVALEANLVKRLRYSFKLVKGRLIKVFTILILGSYVFSSPVYIFNYFAPIELKTTYVVFVLSIITNFIYLFSKPFTACVGVVLFYKLRELNSYNQL